jgi:hypothetical protein
MGIKIRITGLLAIICLLFINANCKKDKCINANYSFVIGVRATPNLDSIFRGDTIWLEINEPVTLTDIGTGTQINFNNATNLGSNIGFQEVVSATQFRNAANDFRYKLLEGTETSNANAELFREYLFLEQNNQYRFRLGIIPQIVGVYRILFGNAANVFRNKSNCEKANFQIDFKQTNQHYYLHPGYSGNPPTSSGVYYFKVK